MSNRKTKKECKTLRFDCRIKPRDKEMIEELCYIDDISKSELFLNMLHDTYLKRIRKYLE